MFGLPSQARYSKDWKQSQEDMQKFSFLLVHLNYNMIQGSYRIFAQKRQKKQLPTPALNSKGTLECTR